MFSGLIISPVEQQPVTEYVEMAAEKLSLPTAMNTAQSPFAMS